MEKRYKLTFKGVSPLTRSTLGDAESNPMDRALADAVHWVWSTQLQIGRLSDSTAAEWEVGSSGSLEQRKAFSRTSFEEHMVLVAGRNLIRALDRAQEQAPALRLTGDLRDRIKLLRDVYEHWDEQRDTFLPGGPPKEKSGKELAERHPEGKPWSITYTADGPVLGGLLPLSALLDSLHELESTILRLETEGT